MQWTGINLLVKAFEQITDEQIKAFEIITKKQRTPALAYGASVDSTLTASNIRMESYLKLLVEMIQQLFLCWRRKIKNNKKRDSHLYFGISRKVFMPFQRAGNGHTFSENRGNDAEIVGE